MTRAALLVLSAMLAPLSAAAAQARPPIDSTVPLSTPDTLFRGQLGGDSATATQVRLRRGGVYRIAVRPATATIEVRPRTFDGAPAQPLTLAPLPIGDSVPGGRGFMLTAATNALHVVAHTNPGSGPATVEVVALSYLPGDATPLIGRTHLIASEQLGVAAILIPLDSGVVYRLFSEATVFISPRMMSGAPIRVAPVSGGTGAPFMVPYPGEYRFASDGESAFMRLYLEEADAARIACVRNPRTAGCRSADRSRGLLGIGLLLVSVPIAVMFLLK